MLITNRVTEKDLRDHLSTIGYFGRSARILELELAGIERPGWIQVFRFHVEAKHETTGWCELWGVIRDDERKRFDAQVCSSIEARDEILAEVSRNLITLNRERSPITVVLAIAAVVGIVLLFCVKLATA